nr:glycosyltransferase family 39 protein [Micromonospora sp. DSM 115978]
DHYVLKYTPFVPGLFAASLVLTGGVTAALALVAGAAVVVTYLLGSEVFGDRRVAAVAATLLAGSPLVVVQSAMLVGYLPVLLLSALAMLGLLRAVRTGHRLPLVGGAFAFGCAAAVRPYDVVLVFVPLVVWAVVVASGRRWWL